MLEKKVAAFLKRQSFNLRNKDIVVGVSGGPDSLALLHFIWNQREERQLNVVAAHVDHMFRGRESYDEAVFVQAFCRKRDIPFEMKQINVPEYIEKTGKSSQVAGRECRYQFFEEIMKKYESSYLCLAHHGDDQIETMLMRVTRGSAGKARAGIPFARPFQNGFIIRPFLCLSKSEIEEYCIKFGLDPRRDPSNEKEWYSRNRFRKAVLPFLKNENPQVHEQFQRFSEELQRDEDFLQELTVQKMNKVMETKDKNHITVDIRGLQTMPIPLQTRGIKLILNYLYKQKPASLSAIHIEQIFSLLKSDHPSGTLDFPNNLKIIRSYGQCHFRFKPAAKIPYCFEISEPGSFPLPNGGMITLEYCKQARCELGNDRILLHKNEISQPLIVRTRRTGDRMSIKGIQGSKKLKDIFIDNKIPLEDREDWPVVTDYEGRILWLPGLKKAIVPSSNNPSASYILLSYKKH